MRFTEKQILVNGDMSNAIVYSNGINIEQGVNWSIQAVWAGSIPQGNLLIQVSNDQVPIETVSGVDPAANVINWTDYTGSGVVVNGNGNFMWIAQNAGYQWVRMKYVKTSGSGTINAVFNGKGA